MNSDAPQPVEATRGNPSFVWRAGQERRLAMTVGAAPLAGRRVLDLGCGLGTYMTAFLRHTPHVFGLDVELERLQSARANGITGVVDAVGERMPYADGAFDVVFSNEVLEHVADDRATAGEIVRILAPGGRAVIFVPNRLYFFETHGIYRNGVYQFGNKPLVNWLPDRWRNRLAPHVRAYTAAGLRQLFAGTPSRVVNLTQIYAGFDNLVRRYGAAGRAVRDIWQGLERTPARVFGLSHMIVVEKVT